jgi:riboflavin synthase
MFTGLVEAIGRVERVEGTSDGRRLHVSVPFAADLQLGDSVAVSGVCLTVVARDGKTFTADLSRETLRATSLGAMVPGRIVNLERPVRADARMGGHFVLGHVDQTGRIAELERDGDGYWLGIEIPDAMEPLVIPKGSIAIDGISLTIASLARGRVGVQIVPFTFSHTSLQEARAGDLVNLEGDVLGKYVARLLALGRRDLDATSPLERHLS